MTTETVDRAYPAINYSPSTVDLRHRVRFDADKCTALLEHLGATEAQIKALNIVVRGSDEENYRGYYDDDNCTIVLFARRRLLRRPYMPLAVGETAEAMDATLRHELQHYADRRVNKTAVNEKVPLYKKVSKPLGSAVLLLTGGMIGYSFSNNRPATVDALYITATYLGASEAAHRILKLLHRANKWERRAYAFQDNPEVVQRFAGIISTGERTSLMDLLVQEAGVMLATLRSGSEGIHSAGESEG